MWCGGPKTYDETRTENIKYLNILQKRSRHFEIGFYVLEELYFLPFVFKNSTTNIRR